MGRMCAICNSPVDEMDSRCKACGNQLDRSVDGDFVFSAADAAAFCAGCGKPAVFGAAFCAYCGARIRDAGIAVHHGEKASGVRAAPGRRAAGAGFQWKWFFKSMGIVFLAILAGLFVMIALSDTPLGRNFVFLMLVNAASLFGGGYVAARLSPGETVREPAWAAVALCFMASLLLGLWNSDAGVVVIVIAMALNFAFALAGAKLGEKHQRKTL